MEIFETIVKLAERVNGMSVIAQTIVFIALVFILVKIPAVKGLFRSNGYCADHKLQVEQMVRNTAAVNNLIERADKHHAEQRGDTQRIFDKIEVQNRLLTEHEIKIEALRESR